MQLFVNSNFIFYMANVLLLVAALLTSILVITFKNPVHVVLSLMLTFLITAVCWITLNAEFLAFILILLYVGAIVILFLFIIMMVDIESPFKDEYDFINRKKHYFKNNVFKSLIIAAGFGGIFIYISKDYTFSITTNLADNNLYLLAQALFADYILLFCMAGLLLLSAIIAVVCLIQTDQINRKMQSIYQQTVTTKQQRLKMLDRI